MVYWGGVTMAGKRTKEIIGQYPTISGLSSNNYGSFSDIWPWPYCGDILEEIEEGFCSEEEIDSLKIHLPSPHPLADSLSEWLWVVTAYALVIVPFVAAVIGIFFWARQNLD
jgi:hypothetical protein